MSIIKTIEKLSISVIQLVLTSILSMLIIAGPCLFGHDVVMYTSVNSVSTFLVTVSIQALIMLSSLGSNGCSHGSGFLGKGNIMLITSGVTFFISMVNIILAVTGISKGYYITFNLISTLCISPAVLYLLIKFYDKIDDTLSLSELLKR